MSSLARRTACCRRIRADMLDLNPLLQLPGWELEQLDVLCVFFTGSQTLQKWSFNEYFLLIKHFTSAQAPSGSTSLAPKLVLSPQMFPTWCNFHEFFFLCREVKLPARFIHLADTNWQAEVAWERGDCGAVEPLNVNPSLPWWMGTGVGSRSAVKTVTKSTFIERNSLESLYCPGTGAGSATGTETSLNYHKRDTVYPSFTWKNSLKTSEYSRYSTFLNVSYRVRVSYRCQLQVISVTPAVRWAPEFTS